VEEEDGGGVDIYMTGWFASLRHTGFHFSITLVPIFLSRWFTISQSWNISHLRSQNDGQGIQDI